MANSNHDSLMELEPSPVEETGSDKVDEGYRSHTIGLSNHSPAWYLSRIQRYSSYAFTAFGLAHVTNTSIIPLITRSVAESERYVLLTRPYYQGLPAEPLLVILPLWAHVLSGVALRVVRRNRNAKNYGDSGSKAGKRSFFNLYFWPRLSGVSQLGFQFLPLLVGHVFINRAVPQSFPGGQSNVNLSYVSHAFAKHPVISYAGFTALIGIGTWHITWGWAKWMGWTPEQVTGVSGGERQLWKKRRWFIINGLAASVAGLWMAGAFGVIGKGGLVPGYRGRIYDEMYKSIPLVGRWL